MGPINETRKTDVFNIKTNVSAALSVNEEIFILMYRTKKAGCLQSLSRKLLGTAITRQNLILTESCPIS